MTLVVDKAEGIARTLGGSAAPALLSPWQQQVADLVAAGLSNRRIADELHISVRTAENHVQAILTALELRNRTQIATWVTEREHAPRSG
jgi:DNA-binding NarL/FixJ family response regulator